jgi:hypothetical protein
MTGPASAPARVSTVGPGKDARWVPLARWALAHAWPVAGSRSDPIAGRTGTA